MDIDTLAKIAEQGMGTLAFIVLIVAGWKVWKFMDLMVNNHLTHIQSSLETVSDHMKDINRSMTDVADSLRRLNIK